MKNYIRRILRQGEELQVDAIEAQPVPVPTLWLLGKTGAGKSSLIRALTGQAEVGSGFAPCTPTAMAFDYPADHPVLRFLDTRGLGEAGYDPQDDLAAAEQGSHAIVVLARLDDPVQGEVANVLRDVRARRPRVPMLVAHTGADLASEEGLRSRARARVQATFEQAAGESLPAVTLALPPGARTPEGIDALCEALAVMLPDVSLLMLRERAQDHEARRFAEQRPLVIWYASAAAASDAAPVVGAVTVPTLQGAMLHALAGRYGVAWNAARAGAFASALGSGILLRYAAAYVARQGAKVIPVFGQTIGAATAATVSFAATYALGRAAAYWLYRTSLGESASAQDLRKLYREALSRARHAPR